MRTKLQRPGVGVCFAVVGAAALPMAAAFVLLPFGGYRFNVKTSRLRANSAVAQGTSGAVVDKAEPAVRARAVESYGKLPLSFEANEGQTDRCVKFLSRGSGYSLFLTGNEAVLALKSHQRSAVSGQQYIVVAQGWVGWLAQTSPLGLRIFQGCYYRVR